MKTGRIVLSCFLMVSIGLFPSCENEPYEGELNIENPNDNDPNDPNDPDAIFQVEVDGELFVGEDVEAESNEDGLQIAAQTGVEAFGLQVFEPAIGSFDFSDESVGLLIYTVDVGDDNSPAYYMTEGTVEITAIDNANNTISGTFQGTMEEWFEEAENVVLTEGVFENIPFSEEAPQDTATALVDGEEFNANTFATVESGNTLALNFLSNTNESIVLNLPADNISTGEHQVGGMGGDYSAIYTFLEGSEPQSYSTVENSGTINITSYQNGIVTGTFTFNVAPFGNTTPIIEITEGEFSMDIN